MSTAFPAASLAMPRRARVMLVSCQSKLCLVDKKLCTAWAPSEAEHILATPHIHRKLGRIKTSGRLRAGKNTPSFISSGNDNRIVLKCD